MKITLSKNAGFCPGVRRADEAVHKLISSSDGNERIFTLGHLIHNGQYNRSLEEKGVRSISLEELTSVLDESDGAPVTLIIRTHGITLECESEIRELQLHHPELKVVDMTCPYVKKIH